MSTIHTIDMNNKPISSFDYDFKSPPTPSTPIIKSKFGNLSDDDYYYHDDDNNHLSPTTFSDKENKYTPIRCDNKSNMQLPPKLSLSKTQSEYKLGYSSYIPPSSSLSPFPPNIAFNNTYNTLSPYPPHIPFNTYSPPNYYPNYNYLAPPFSDLSEERVRKRMNTMNNNRDEYNNTNHPNKRRKINHPNEQYQNQRPSGFYNNSNINNIVPGNIQQYQSERNNISGLLSGAESENEPIISPNKANKASNNITVIDEEEKTNHNLTKRALFKEKLSNININANDVNLVNDQHSTLSLPNISRNANADDNDADNVGVGDHDNTNNTNPNHPNNSNLDWFGHDENINTLNANNHHPFEMNMFSMGIGDDMKDMGMIPNFMMNDMMEMDYPINAISHNVKRETHNILPPQITTNTNYNVAPPSMTQNYHASNLPNFSMSVSPPQQSPMFMDQINTNYHHYTMINNNNNNNNNNINHNTLRPANLPNLRGSSSVTSSSQSGRNNNNINNNNKSSSSSSSSHILTPFDYPLSNPTINSNSDDGYNKSKTRQFNFLWWYPEIKFCELDPAVVPLP